MAIQSCSLVCQNSSSAPGSQFSCGITDVFLNQEIRVRFSNPIRASSVTGSTFQLVERDTGRAPPGDTSIDPGDPSTLIYRPRLTVDSSGNPIFGLTAGETYDLKIPGTLLDDPPYISSQIGQLNSSRLFCTLVASRGVFDAKPGSPRVSVTVDRVIRDGGGNPIGIEEGVPANGAVDVSSGTLITLVFDDVMNPATLVNTVDGESETILISVDPDGNTVDSTDQVDLAGFFTIRTDQQALETTVIFHPSAGLPSAGSEIPARKIVVLLRAQIFDLGGNALVNSGKFVFEPEKITFQEVEISESFESIVNEDSIRSGNDWGPSVLGKGPGGGSGRLGDLVVLPGEVVELDTDSEDFVDIDDLEMFNPDNVIDRPTPLVVEGGVFEFSRMRIDAGGTLRFRGTNAARVYVRGEAVIQGLIDVAGTSAVIHSANDLEGGVGGDPGPGGGAGGNGGMRPDGTNFTLVGGVRNPDAGPEDVLDPATYDRVNGQTGGGIPFPSTLVPAPTFVCFGGGGFSWPQPSLANPALHMPSVGTDVAGMQFEKLQECRTVTPGAPGGGAAYALPGKPGVPVFGGILSSPVTQAPSTPGGDSADLEIDESVRSLSPEIGLLRGGGGGGGGGAHLQRTQINGVQLFDCSIPIPAGSPSSISLYLAHSSAAGGGGGGALQITGGSRVILNGLINASGGDGGSGFFPPPPSSPEDFAQAGGAGAGGAVLLQGPQILIQSVPGRIDISGGLGGEGTGNPFPIQPSRGGDGSPGFLRMEADNAPSIAIESPKVVPTEATLQAQYGSGVEVEDIISTAVWTPLAEPPSGMSGAQSCWLRPPGNFFELQFEEDGAELGWDMRLKLAGTATPQSYRGPNIVFPQPLEQVFGTQFGSSPLIIRFQGARARGTLVDPCSVPETGVDSPLETDSLSDWVSHPAELNDFHQDSGLTPNIFRFVIVWDRSQPGFDLIESIEDIRVRALPD